MPAVAVVIPVFNRVAETMRAIASVESQSFKDYELIVVDDGSFISLDPVAAKCKEVGARFIRQEHSGVSAARNHGVRCSESPWIAFLDSDDEWLPKKLEAQIRLLEEGRRYKICQTEEIWIRRGTFVNPKLRHQKPDGEAFYRSLELCCISPSAVIIARELLDAVGGFDEEMRVCEDYDLWLRITARHMVPLVRERLIKKFGGHEDQLSRSEPAMDRFRAYALTKLLVQQDLSAEKAKAALSALQMKARVVLTGAEKRGTTDVAKVYVALLEVLSGAATDTVEAMERLLPRLLLDIKNSASYF